MCSIPHLSSSLTMKFIMTSAFFKEVFISLKIGMNIFLKEYFILQKKYKQKEEISYTMKAIHMILFISYNKENFLVLNNMCILHLSSFKMKEMTSIKLEQT